MSTIRAEKRMTGAARKLFNWRGYAVGNLSLDGKKESIPVLVRMDDAKRIMDKKEKELELELCGEAFKVKVSRLLWNPETSLVDEIDFAQ